MVDAGEFAAEAVIMDAGAFPESPEALRWLDGGLPVVCCDGAADRFLATGRVPWRIVGDCDSMSQDVRRNYAEIIRRNPDQETNDQTKAVEYLVGHDVNRIVILGATGLREDHTLGNISLLIEYMRRGLEVRAYTDYGVFIPCRGDMEFDCAPGVQVSVFSFGATGMTSDGLRYPLRDFVNWWEGTLNEVSSSPFRINAHGDYMVFINYHREQR